MPSVSPLLAPMIEAATAAGASLARDFAALKDLEVVRKGPGADYVSQADVKAEAIVRDTLARHFPDYGFLGEEGGRFDGADAAHVWMVDPLDGTTNFLFGLPLWAVNVALARDGQVVGAVTYNPILDELYWAETGGGCWLNGERIRVSQRARVADALLSVGIPFAGKSHHGLFAEEARLLTANVAGLRRLGSAAMDMAYVAAGRFDAYWERQLNAWDMGAGVLLATEAGGRATDALGGPLDLEGGSVCISNGLIHDELIAVLARAAENDTRAPEGLS